MPRVAEAINNEFIHVDYEGKSPMVLCKHCNRQRVAKGSNKRKASHLRQCEAYIQTLGGKLPNLGDDLADVPIRQTIVVAEPYWWPHDASLKIETTALVIIDMQRDCTSIRLLPRRSMTVVC